MKKIASILILFISLITLLTAADYDAQELGNRLFAVHATDVFPKNGVAVAGFESECEIPDNFPNFRATIHFAIGEVVRPLGDSDNWEEKKYAIVAPLNQLYPQLINLNCYDTFILGNFKLNEETFLVAPVGTKSDGFPFKIYEYGENTSLRDAVDDLILSQEGWKVEMSDDNEEEEFAPAMVAGININTHEFFQPILDLLPHLSLGLRWERYHGQAWRFADTEMLLLDLYYIFYDDERVVSIDYLSCIRKELKKHYKVFSKTYLVAPFLDNASKVILIEKLDIIDQWIEMIDFEIQNLDSQAA